MLARIAVIAAAVGAVSAQLRVIVPGGPDLWWVAQSENNIIWTCRDSQVQNFTVLLTNQNPAILVAPLAILAVVNNFDCSRSITTQQANLPVSTGYRVQLANPINNTDVYAESDFFEVKPIGSTYPDASATPTGTSTGSSTGTGTATGTGTDAPGQTSNAASAVLTGMGGFGGLVAAVAAFVL